MMIVVLTAIVPTSCWVSVGCDRFKLWGMCGCMLDGFVNCSTCWPCCSLLLVELARVVGKLEMVVVMSKERSSSCIVSGSYDGSVQVWDVLSGVELKVLNSHSSNVNSAAFFSDGSCIVSGSDNRSVCLWNALSGVKLKVLNGHSSSVLSVAFSSDGTHIVSGSSNK